jgi:PHD/YefM family antitoxin component YafN of YafNO toxin-antitoxin module
VITQNGKPAGVLLPRAEFDRLMGRERFLTDVAAGVANLDAGRTVTTMELKRRLGLGDDLGA